MNTRIKDTSTVLRLFGNEAIVKKEKKKVIRDNLLKYDKVTTCQKLIQYEKGFVYYSNGVVLLKEKVEYEKEKEGICFDIVDNMQECEIDLKQFDPHGETKFVSYIDDSQKQSILPVACAGHLLSKKSGKNNPVYMVIKNVYYNASLLFAVLSYAEKNNYNRVYQTKHREKKYFKGIVECEREDGSYLLLCNTLDRVKEHRTYFDNYNLLTNYERFNKLQGIWEKV